MNISHLQATTAVGRGKICPREDWGGGFFLLLLLDDAGKNSLYLAFGKVKGFLYTLPLWTQMIPQLRSLLLTMFWLLAAVVSHSIVPFYACYHHISQAT